MADIDSMDNYFALIDPISKEEVERYVPLYDELGARYSRACLARIARKAERLYVPRSGEPVYGFAIDSSGTLRATEPITEAVKVRGRRS